VGARIHQFSPQNATNCATHINKNRTRNRSADLSLNHPSKPPGEPKKEKKGNQSPPTTSLQTRLQSRIFLFKVSMRSTARSLSNGRWLIKDKYFNPPGIYLTTSFTEAKIYAQDHGAIVIVKTARIIPLKQTTPEYWVFEIELFEENEYYSVWGLEPVAVLNTEMVRIA